MDAITISTKRRKRQKTIALAVAAFAGILLFTNAPQLFRSKEGSLPPSLAIANDLNDSLLTALKEQNQWKEQQIAAVNEELKTQTKLVEDAEQQLSQKEQLIEELKIAQLDLQQNLDAGRLHAKALEESIETHQYLVKQDLSNKEKEFRNLQQELLNLKAALQQTKSLHESEKVAILNQMGLIQESERQLKTALTDKSNQIRTLEEQIKDLAARKAELEAEDLHLAQLTAEQFKEKYLQEHTQLLAKEALLAQLTRTLTEQKESLGSLDRARIALVEELEENKKTISQLSQLTAITKHTLPTENTMKRVHVVNKGETLSGISQQYYGTTKRLEEIYEANKEFIANRNQIKPGTKLIIP